MSDDMRPSGDGARTLHQRGKFAALNRRNFDMDGIIAVAFLVGCASDLLICEDLPARPDRFADMEACGTALPALIQHHESQDGGPPVVMGKCGLMVRPSMPPQNAAVFAATSR